MAASGQATVAITVTTLDPNRSRTLEPRAAAPARRLRTMRTLTGAGIPVGVSIAPVIPFIPEPDIERVLEAKRGNRFSQFDTSQLRRPLVPPPGARAQAAARQRDLC